MPTFSYSNTNYPFQAFSKIRSADTNQMFSDLQTFFNTTKLSSTNIQVHGLTRTGSSSNIAASTPRAVMVNDTNGDIADLSPVASGAVYFSAGGTPTPTAGTLPLAAGGTGSSLTLTSNPGDVVQVNSAATALEISAPTGVSASLRLYQYYNLT